MNPRRNAAQVRSLAFRATAQDEATGWQRESRQKLLGLMMGGQTPESVPLKPQVLRREEVPAGSYVVEEFTLQALPDRRVHVWMAVPRQPRGKVGAMLAINGHAGTAVAIEAGLLTPDEIASSLTSMRANVRAAGVASIGLTVYPPYPKDFFKNTSMGPYSHQNGGDWCWFGGWMIQQLIRHGFVQEAYAELKPMVVRVRKHGDFYEWWSLDNQPRGSKQYRGSAGVLGKAIEQLLDWAEANRGQRRQEKGTLP